MRRSRGAVVVGLPALTFAVAALRLLLADIAYPHPSSSFAAAVAGMLRAAGRRLSPLATPRPAEPPRPEPSQECVCTVG